MGKIGMPDLKESLRDIINTSNGLITVVTDYTKLIPYGGTTTNIGNAYSIPTPVIDTLDIGMGVCFKCTADSTGAVTLNWDGTGAKAIKKANGTNVTNLKADGIYTVRYSGTNFMLQGEGGDIPVAGSQSYSTPGTYNFTVPAGVTTLLARMWGGGGGGGGGTLGGTATSYSGSGGNGSNYRACLIAVNPFDVISIVVGAGGIAGIGGASPTDGGNGGNSSVGSILISGGYGGKKLGAQSLIQPIATGQTGTLIETIGGRGQLSVSNGYGGNGSGAGGSSKDGNEAWQGGYGTSAGLLSSDAGGNGGLQGYNGVVAQPGIQPGGGGGGGAPYYTAYLTGAVGGNGQVKLSWS
jgi:hypothetical protein